MVMRTYWKPTFALSALALVSVPVAADGILEQIQNEVATIAERTRIAVVTVEDERAVFTDRDFRFFLEGENDFVTLAGAKRVAEERVKHLDIDLKALDKRLLDLKVQFDAGQIEIGLLDDANREKANLTLERTSLTQLLAGTATATTTALSQAQRLLAESLGNALRRQADAEESLIELRLKYSEAHPQMVAALDRLRAYQKSATEKEEKLKVEAPTCLPEVYATRWREVLQKQSEAEEHLQELQQSKTAVHPSVLKAKEQLNFYQKRAAAWEKKVKEAESPKSMTWFASADAAPRSGTGFCIGEGYIVTTADVVEGMARPVVITDNGSRIKAKVIGVRGDMNVGLLQVQAKVELPALKFGDSASLAPGHFAISVGNQGGQTNFVALTLVGGLKTEGTYSGTRFYPRLIQIAGTVGAGTSGAPLVNARGEAIGIMVAVPTSVNFVQTTVRGSNRFATPSVPNTSSTNTKEKSAKSHGSAVRGRVQERTEAQAFTFRGRYFDQAQINDLPLLPNTPFFSGMSRNNNLNRTPQMFTAQLPVTSAGYAIPINDLKPVIEEIRQGKVTRGWIGIAPADVERVSEADGIIHIERTVKVEGVFPESPAARANLQPGDVLLELDGKPIRSAADIREASLRVRPGDTLRLALRRPSDTKPITLRFTLKIEPRPADADVKAPMKEKDRVKSDSTKSDSTKSDSIKENTIK
jgi:S1-C subfamily serine protease